MFICPFVNSVTCEYGECFKCEDCEHNPKNFMPAETDEIQKQFEETPWAIYCMSCGEFVKDKNEHPGHLLATGIGEYNEKIPDQILDRLKRRD